MKKIFILLNILIFASCVPQVQEEELEFDTINGGEDSPISQIDVENDKTAPSAPSQFRNTGINTNSISLAWNSSVDNESGVSGYKLYRNGSMYKTLSKVTAYTDSGLSPNTTYQYFVIAFDANNNLSVASNVLSLKTLATTSLTIASPAPNASFSTTSVSISGNCIQGRNVKITSTGLIQNYEMSCSNSQYNAGVTLTSTEGSKEITVSQLDNNSNEIKVKVVINYSKVVVTPPPTQTYDFQKVKGILQAKCLSCHSSSAAGNFAQYTTEDAWKKETYYVKIGDPLNSPLYYRLKGASGSGNKNMPVGQTIAQADVDYIKNWIQNLTPLDETTPPPVGNPPPTGTVVESATRLRIGETQFVANIMYSIFGRDANTNTVIMDNIIKQKDAFGGGCDYYDTSRAVDDSLEYPEYGCYGTVSTTEQVPSSQALREANRIKTCELVVKNNVAIDFALTKIYSGGGYLKPDSAKLTKAYNLFYPVESPSSEVISSLQNLANSKADNREAWRVVFLGLCHSPEWQIP